MFTVRGASGSTLVEVAAIAADRKELLCTVLRP